MAWFWKRSARTQPDSELREKVAALEVDLRALARDMIDLDRSVARWMKRTQADARAVALTEEPRAQALGARTPPTAPAGLRGARLRIWQRQHGIAPDGALTVADANGDAEE